MACYKPLHAIIMANVEGSGDENTSKNHARFEEEYGVISQFIKTEPGNNSNSIFDASSDQNEEDITNRLTDTLLACGALDYHGNTAPTEEIYLANNPMRNDIQRQQSRQKESIWRYETFENQTNEYDSNSLIANGNDQNPREYSAPNNFKYDRMNSVSETENLHIGPKGSQLYSNNLESLWSPSYGNLFGESDSIQDTNERSSFISTYLPLENELSFKLDGPTGKIAEPKNTTTTSGCDEKFTSPFFWEEPETFVPKTPEHKKSEPWFPWKTDTNKPRSSLPSYPCTPPDASMESESWRRKDENTSKREDNAYSPKAYSLAAGNNETDPRTAMTETSRSIGNASLFHSPSQTQSRISGSMLSTEANKTKSKWNIADSKNEKIRSLVSQDMKDNYKTPVKSSTRNTMKTDGAKEGTPFRVRQDSPIRISPSSPTSSWSSAVSSTTAPSTPVNASTGPTTISIANNVKSSSKSRYAPVGSSTEDPIPSTPWEERLLNELTYLRTNSNNGFGIVPVVNRFTRPSRDGPQGIDSELPASDTPVVLCHMLFKRNRIGLYQCEAYLPKSGSIRMSVADFMTECKRKKDSALLVMEIDGGEDICEVVNSTPFQLTPGFPEAPFAPIKRIATAADRAMRSQREAQENMVLEKCSELLSQPKPLQPKDTNLRRRREKNGLAYSVSHLKGVMKVVDAELQLDGARLLLFTELKYKADWNVLCKIMFDFCVCNLRCRPRVWIQRKLLA